MKAVQLCRYSVKRGKDEGTGYADHGVGDVEVIEREGAPGGEGADYEGDPSDDLRIYIRKETVENDDFGSQGWCVVCYNGSSQ